MRELESLPPLLLEWYGRCARILPWRSEPTPYRVWVSEVMLQQTRVEAVRPYFLRFMDALPDIPALAACPEDVLLKLWEGLGYYNRARNLKKAADVIVREYDGVMPPQYQELKKLPGIGCYTAGAIASIVFGEDVPAVDGNVLRVLSRLGMDERFMSDGKVKAAVEEDLKAVIPLDRPGDFNQALMEIGACVCIPNGAPLCGECPLGKVCMAHEAGREQEYPMKQAKKPRKLEYKTILLVKDSNKTAIRKRPDKGLLAGMYEFPSMEGFRTAEEVAAYLAENGLKTVQILPLERSKHVFTHKEWHMKGYLVRVDQPESEGRTDLTGDWLYIEPKDTRRNYPIPSAFGAYLKYLDIRPGGEMPGINDENGGKGT